MSRGRTTGFGLTTPGALSRRTEGVKSLLRPSSFFGRSGARISAYLLPGRNVGVSPTGVPPTAGRLHLPLAARDPAAGAFARPAYDSHATFSIHRGPSLRGALTKVETG